MNNKRRAALRVGALVACCCAMTWAYGQGGVTAQAASGHDFEAQKVHKLGSLNADFLCERLYDSANPVGMAAELARIVGPGVLIGKFPELGGKITPEQKKMYANLRILARQKVWVPVSAERTMGEWMDQKARREGLMVDPAGLPKNMRPRYELTKSLLDGIVATLPSDNPYTFTLAITQADESNASITPGGFIYVTTGMLQDKTLDRNDIALRLAHEVAHLTRRHALKEIQVKVVDALEITRSLKPLLDFAQQPTRVMETLFGKMKAAEMMFQRFDEVQELEGDACGTQLLVKQPGIDAAAAVKRFASARAGTGKGKGWDVSHPAPEERALVMNAQLDPALRARVAQLRTGGGQTTAQSADPTAAPTKMRGLQPAPSPSTLTATEAAPQNPPAAAKGNPLSSAIDKLRSMQPTGGAKGTTAGNPTEAP
jgi:predicted Zn-dependent protease